VKYVKRNALAGRSFESFAQLESHLAGWMRQADERRHGTTHETPLMRFERAERTALQPLPFRALPVREKRLKRRVAHDALVDVETVRYSVPHRLVREHVDVAIGEDEVRIYFGAELVASHVRAREPYVHVTRPEHYEGLWRREPSPMVPPAPDVTLREYGRALSDYAAVVGGES